MVPTGGVPSGGFRVIFIAHGAGGRGLDHCSFWDPHLPPDFVLVCPAGALLDRREPEGGAFFPDHLALRAELTALLLALKGEFAGKLRSSFRYMGYSQGATMGALAVVGELPIFTELVLLEGGAENWTALRVQEFAAGGGERVLLACGTKGCARHSERARGAFERGGVSLDVVDAIGTGHTYGGAVGQGALRVILGWEPKDGKER
jgi:predicted esterase